MDYRPPPPPPPPGQKCPYAYAQRVPEVQFLISFFMIALYFPPTILVLFFDMQSVIFDNITQILCKCSCFCIKCCHKVIAHSQAPQKHVAFIVPNDTNWSFQVQLNFPCAQSLVVSRVVTPPKNFLRKKPHWRQGLLPWANFPPFLDLKLRKNLRNSVNIQMKSRI